ncbi:MAG: molybdenum cofactor guanylyltransferase MobA [Gammaproteobacteria bacterium]
MSADIADYGVILAGGRGSRMGLVDKPLLDLGGTPLIQWVVTRAQPQVRQLLLCVNRNPERYQFLNLDQFGDYSNPYAGPLLGIVSAMRQLAKTAQDQQQLLACFPADVPWFPSDIVARLISQMQQEDSDVAVVQEGEQLQPLFSVWKISLRTELEKAVSEGLFGPKLVLPRLNTSVLQVDSSKQEFFNINTHDDLAKAQEVIGNTRGRQV